MSGLLEIPGRDTGPDLGLELAAPSRYRRLLATVDPAREQLTAILARARELIRVEYERYAGSLQRGGRVPRGLLDRVSEIIRAAYRAGGVVGARLAARQLDVLGIPVSQTPPPTASGTLTRLVADFLGGQHEEVEGDEEHPLVAYLMLRALAGAFTAGTTGVSEAQEAKIRASRNAAVVRGDSAGQGAGEPGPVPMLYKLWVAQTDSRTCAVCLALHGTVVPFDDDFPIPDVRGYIPYGGRLRGPPAHPRCRCGWVTAPLDEIARTGPNSPGAMRNYAAARLTHTGKLTGDRDGLVIALHGHKGEPGYTLLHPMGSPETKVANQLYDIGGQGVVSQAGVDAIRSGASPQQVAGKALASRGEMGRLRSLITEAREAGNTADAKTYVKALAFQADEDELAKLKNLVADDSVLLAVANKASTVGSIKGIPKTRAKKPTPVEILLEAHPPGVYSVVDSSVSVTIHPDGTTIHRIMPDDPGMKLKPEEAVHWFTEVTAELEYDSRDPDPHVDVDSTYQLGKTTIHVPGGSTLYVGQSSVSGKPTARVIHPDGTGTFYGSQDVVIEDENTVTAFLTDVPPDWFNASLDASPVAAAQTPPGTLNTTVGGVEVNADQITHAIGVLTDATGIMVKQPLVKAASKLATMDYHAVAAPFKAQFGNQTKPAVIHALNLALTDTNPATPVGSTPGATALASHVGADLGDGEHGVDLDGLAESGGFTSTVGEGVHVALHELDPDLDHEDHPPGPATATVGGVLVTAQDIQTAIEALASSKTIMVKQPLTKIDSPLAGMDYHAVAAPYLGKATKAKGAPKAKGGTGGKPSTKNAVIESLTQTLAGMGVGTHTDADGLVSDGVVPASVPDNPTEAVGVDYPTPGFLSSSDPDLPPGGIDYPTLGLYLPPGEYVHDTGDVVTVADGEASLKPSGEPDEMAIPLDFAFIVESDIIGHHPNQYHPTDAPEPNESGWFDDAPTLSSTTPGVYANGLSAEHVVVHDDGSGTYKSGLDSISLNAKQVSQLLSRGEWSKEAGDPAETAHPQVPTFDGLPTGLYKAPGGQWAVLYENGTVAFGGPGGLPTSKPYGQGDGFDLSYNYQWSTPVTPTMYTVAPATMGVEPGYYHSGDLGQFAVVHADGTVQYDGSQTKAPFNTSIGYVESDFPKAGDESGTTNFTSIPDKPDTSLFAVAGVSTPEGPVPPGLYSDGELIVTPGGGVHHTTSGWLGGEAKLAAVAPFVQPPDAPGESPQPDPDPAAKAPQWVPSLGVSSGKYQYANGYNAPFTVDPDGSVHSHLTGSTLVPGGPVEKTVVAEIHAGDLVPVAGQEVEGPPAVTVGIPHSVEPGTTSVAVGTYVTPQGGQYTVYPSGDVYASIGSNPLSGSKDTVVGWIASGKAVPVAPGNLEYLGVPPGTYQVAGGEGGPVYAILPTAKIVHPDGLEVFSPKAIDGLLSGIKSGDFVLIQPGSPDPTPSVPPSTVPPSSIPPTPSVPADAIVLTYPSPGQKLAYVSAKDLNAIVKSLAAEAGHAKTVAHVTGGSKDEKVSWIKAWYSGQWDEAYTIEAGIAQRSTKSGKHKAAKTHPGSPDNPANAGGFAKPYVAAHVYGEVPAGQSVPGDWTLLPTGHIDPYVDSDEVDAYMVAAHMANAEGLTLYQKRDWMRFHHHGNKYATDTLSKIAKRNVDNGQFYSEPIGNFASVEVGDPVAVPGEWPTFNPRISHAVGLSEAQLDWYLDQIAPTKRVGTVLRSQSGEAKRVMVQAHWMAARTDLPSDAAFTRAEAKTRIAAILSAVSEHVKLGTAIDTSVFQVPVVHDFTPVPGTDLGGTGVKHLLEDETGKRYVFKDFDTEPFRADTEHHAHEIARVFGFTPADSRTGTYKGRFGQYQALLPATGDLAGVDPGELTSTQLADLARNHVLDWVLGNDDGHKHNYLSVSGRMVPIDLGRSLATFGGPQGLKLTRTDMSPRNHLYYEDMYRAMVEGGISGEMVDAAYAAAMAKARSMVRSDDDRLTTLLEGALARRPAHTYGATAATNKDDLIGLVLRRKNALETDFQEFWDTLYADLGRDKPAYAAPLADGVHAGLTPDLLAQASSVGSSGVSAMFATPDLEDTHLLAQVVDKPIGVSQAGGSELWLSGQVRENADRRLTQWLDSLLDPAKIQSGVKGAQQTKQNPLAATIQTNHDTIVAAAKTVSYHAADKNPNQVKMDALVALKTDLTESVERIDAGKSLGQMNEHDLAQYRAMAVQYLADIARVEDAAAIGGTFHSGDFQPYQYQQPVEDAVPQFSLPSIGLESVRKVPAYFERGEVTDDGRLRLTGGTDRTGQEGSMYVLGFDDGTEVEYRPWVGGGYQSAVVPSAQQGMLKIKVRAYDGTPVGAQRALDGLAVGGLETAPATDLDAELFYWRHMYGVLQNRKGRDSQPYAAVLAAVSDPGTGLGSPVTDTPEGELGMWRDAWSEVGGRKAVDDFAATRGYLPRFSRPNVRRSDLTGGHPYWYRFDVDRAQLAEAKSLSHSVGSFKDLSYITGYGALLSTEDRWQKLGLWTNGMSSTSDQKQGSSNGVFTRYGTNGQIFFSPLALARTSTYSFSGDLFGDIEQRKNAAPIDPFTVVREYEKSHGNETVIKHAQTILDDVEVVLFSDYSAREAYLEKLRTMGIDTIRGLPIEERFVLSHRREVALSKANAARRERVKLGWE